MDDDLQEIFEERIESLEERCNQLELQVSALLSCESNQDANIALGVASILNAASAYVQSWRLQRQRKKR